MPVEPIILPFRHGPFRNVSYVIADPETRRALAIDPAWEMPAILAALAGEGLELSAILLTHGHHDHVHGVAELAAASSAPVFAHADEQLNELAESFEGPVTRIADGERLEIGTLVVELLHTPGHTFGSVIARAGSHLFTGDAMMVASMGRPGSTYEHILAMWESAQRVFQPLADDVVVHPGHDAGPSALATMAEQRQRIPALRAGSLDEFIDAMERETNRILRP